MQNTDFYGLKQYQGAFNNLKNLFQMVKWFSLVTQTFQQLLPYSNIHICGSKPLSNYTHSFPNKENEWWVLLKVSPVSLSSNLSTHTMLGENTWKIVP